MVIAILRFLLRPAVRALPFFGIMSWAWDDRIPHSDWRKPVGTLIYAIFILVVVLAITEHSDKNLLTFTEASTK